MDFTFQLKEEIVVVNAPLILLIAAVNIFYGLSSFINRRKFQPPVRILLGRVIGSAILYCGYMIVMYCVPRDQQIVVIVLWAIAQYCAYCNMTCFVFLNLYYYVHIVPAQKAIFIWIKKNTGPIIYVILVCDTVLNLISCAFSALEMIHKMKEDTFENYTQTNDQEDFSYTNHTWYCIIQFYTLLCFWIMMVCTFSTVWYLQRHLRRVARTAGRLATPLYQGQMRVTITGIVQGLLYIFFCTLYACETFTSIFFTEDLFSNEVSLTIITVYISFNTAILGFGQATIRQDAAIVWKALKARCVVSN